MRHPKHGIVPFKTAADVLSNSIDSAAKQLQSDSDDNDSSNLSEFQRKAAQQLASMFIPATVLRAFCIELTLKAILQEVKGSYPKSHNLVDLYNQIPSSRRLLVEGNVNHDAFSEKLQAAQSEFVDWRYFFDNNDPINSDTSFMKSLLNALLEEFISELT